MDIVRSICMYLCMYIYVRTHKCYVSTYIYSIKAHKMRANVCMYVLMYVCMKQLITCKEVAVSFLEDIKSQLLLCCFGIGVSVELPHGSALHDFTNQFSRLT